MEGLKTLTIKEQNRIHVLNGVNAGEVTAAQAAVLMEVSERQGRRLLAAYRKEGAICHSSREQGWEAVDDHGHRYTTEGQGVGRRTVGRFQPQPSDRDAIGARRDRSVTLHCQEDTSGRRLAQSAASQSLQAVQSSRALPQEGMLLQVDGSRHDWLEGRGPYLTLVGAVDDATGTVPAALFRHQEDAQGYLMILKPRARAARGSISMVSDVN